jgi:pilus assembly protein CpaF
MIKLTITEKGGEPKPLTFEKDEISIGRVSGNDIVLPKGNVSKRHSKLTLRNGQIEVNDLKSTNGTYVNGRKIAEPVTLTPSDRVFVGDFLIIIEPPAGAEAGSGARVPPPPPPPRPSGRFAPMQQAQSAEPPEGQDEDEELGLAARPPRSGRLSVPPPPPPPPPRNRPTPSASRPLEDEDDELDRSLAPPSADELGAADEELSDAGLFNRGSGRAEEAFDGAGARGTGTGKRPAPAQLAETPGPISASSVPAPAPPPAPPAPGFGAAPADSAPAARSSAAAAAAEGGLDGLLADPGVTQILITGPDAVYVDRGHGLTPFSEALGDTNAIADALWRLANTAVPPPPPDNPVVDVRLPDGTRIAAVFPPVSSAGVVGSVRRPGLPERTLADLVPAGGADIQMLLGAVVATRRNLLVTGDSSAVAALLGALAGAIPTERRVVSIGAGLARARAGWTDLAPSADMPALVRVAAALAADHLLVAEVSGTEMLDLVLAAARGQEGLAVAFPARATGEALARLEAILIPSVGSAGGAAVASLVSSTIDLVVHAAVTSDGGARIVEIAEPTADEARLTAEPVVVWRGEGGRRGEGTGRLEVSGVSTRLSAAIAAAGSALPAGLVRK